MIKTNPIDQQALGEQERIVGRPKVNGEPTVRQDPVSHAMKTNPGRPEDTLRRFLRRGYALLRPRDSGLRRGLVFIAFGRALSTQVEFVRRAWINNENFPHNCAGKDALVAQFADSRLMCGGHYFAPSAHPTQPWSWIIAEPESQPTAL